MDLRALELAPGAAVRLPVRTPPVELVIGGQEHRTEPERPELELEVARSLSGLHLRLRGEAVLVGPCVRCLEEARAPLSVDTSEFVAAGRRLLASATAPTAVMCAEARPDQCHRQLLADWLVVQGAEVHHILGPGSQRPHVLTTFARRDGKRVIYDAGPKTGS